MSNQSSYPKVKYPEPWLDDHWYYAHDDVLDWFKRCMAEFISIQGSGGSASHPSWTDIQVRRWFETWFSQFKNWEEFDWNKALEVHSSPTTTRESE